MTTDPKQGAQALQELEHGSYTGRLERVASILEMKLVYYQSSFEQYEPSRVELWRNVDSTQKFPDYEFTAGQAHTFLYGVAVGI